MIPGKNRQCNLHRYKELILLPSKACTIYNRKHPKLDYMQLNLYPMCLTWDIHVKQLAGCAKIYHSVAFSDNWLNAGTQPLCNRLSFILILKFLVVKGIAWLYFLILYPVLHFRLSCVRKESGFYFGVSWIQLQFGQRCQLFCTDQADASEPGLARSQSEDTWLESAVCRAALHLSAKCHVYPSTLLS